MITAGCNGWTMPSQSWTSTGTASSLWRRLWTSYPSRQRTLTMIWSLSASSRSAYPCLTRHICLELLLFILGGWIHVLMSPFSSPKARLDRSWTFAPRYAMYPTDDMDFSASFRSVFNCHDTSCMLLSMLFHSCLRGADEGLSSHLSVKPKVLCLSWRITRSPGLTRTATCRP